ncbi:MAG: biotin--[acetyl-CoA-carboxylase] ligase [Treponema sp.]|jgi:BirA family biotin operon repressor/biotin-[acetyl-CoA-carboxylase] ligase|nr:biotin--[acetyl-CoA-carboxylase] ligase [Treponema sp.]
METLPVANPFGAPVYYRDLVSSTMDEARVLAKDGAPHGTVASAGFQERGRGSRGRMWNAEGGKNLFFTILLRYGGFDAVPRCLTLRTGLALSLAVEDLAGDLGIRLPRPVLVKWPNDVMIPLVLGESVFYRKTAGILTEANGSAVFTGVGVNVGQSEFQEELRDRAGSLAMAFGPLSPRAPLVMLEKTLSRLYREIETPSAAPSWTERLDERLYRKGERVRFRVGAADAGNVVEGILRGIGRNGEILIDTEGGTETFVSGELEFGGTAWGR